MALVLGTFAFSEFEIPASLPFGGRQALKVHRYMGGKRVIDALGPDDAPIQWSGQFRGFTASLRARQLDLMRSAGRPLVLTWGVFVYRVVIESFEADYQAPFEIPYRISCVVLSDIIAEKTAPLVQRIEDSLRDGIADALGISADDEFLGPVVGGVQTALQSFATGGRFTVDAASGAALAGFQATLGGAAASTADYGAALGETLDGSGIAGVQAGGDPAVMAAGVNTTVQAADGAYRSEAVSALLTKLRNEVGAVTQ